MEKGLPRTIRPCPQSASAAGLEDFKERDGKPGQWGGCQGGEGIHHKRLKEFILENPHRLGISDQRVMSKRTEQELLSGDSIDVFFATESVSYAVEVKSAQQESNPDDGSIVAKLVVEREPPRDLVDLGLRLKVKIHIVQVNR